MLISLSVVSNPNNNHSDIFDKQHFCEFISVATISSLIKRLSSGKAIGVDKIPAEVYIHASHRLRTLITIFINSCFRHTYMPQIISDTILVPIVKNRLKPATESDNYRPIAIATAISKLFELVILNKCEELLSTCDNQFGFKDAVSVFFRCHRYSLHLNHENRPIIYTYR